MATKISPLTTGIISTESERARSASEDTPPPVSMLDKILSYLRYSPFDTLAVGDYLLFAFLLFVVEHC